MTFQEKLDQLERLDQLIRMKATGSPRDLANRMNISERFLYKLIFIMKERGAPIYFNKRLNSYQYEYEGTFTAKFLAPSEKN